MADSTIPTNLENDKPFSDTGLLGKPVLGAAALNTHFFDGHLGEKGSFISSLEESTSRDIKENIERAGSVDKETKSECFLKLYKHIRTQTKFPVTVNADRCLKIIISIHEAYGRTKLPNNQNYSSSDDLHACDLLYLLYEKIVEENDPEYLSLMLSQLDEMASGLCVQGKNNRLFQTLIMLRTDLTSTSK
jgi:hypothetical protein